MSGVKQDIIHALRLYRGTPLASVLAVLVLGTALAFLTAFLSLYAELMPRNHPGFEQASELVTPAVQMAENRASFSLPVVEQFEERISGLDQVAGLFRLSVEILEADGIEELNAEAVTRSFFSGLQPRLALGRGIAAEQHDPDGLPEVVISYALWQRSFGGSPNVLGREIELQGPPFISTSEDDHISFGRHRIVGVADRRMHGPWGGNIDAWLAAERVLPMLLTEMPMQIGVESMSIFRMLARSAPQRSIASIESEIVSRYEDGQIENYTLPRDGRWRVYAGVNPNPEEQERLRRQVGLFLLVSILVVVVAGANVGQFLLARAPGRRRELGIRQSVGAPMRRLRRQLLIEAAVLVVAALAAGILMSLWLVVLLQELAFLKSSQWGNVTMLDWRVMGAVALVATVTVLLVSLAPIAGLKRIGVMGATRSVSARASLFQRTGGALQVCVAGIVSCVALGFGAYLADLTARDPGWNPDNLVHIIPQIRGVIISSDTTEDTNRLRRENYRQVLLAIPGVEDVGFGAPVPAGRRSMSMTSSVPLPDQPGESVDIARTATDDGFPRVLGMRVLHGDWPGPEETSGYVINRLAAETLFGRVDAVGLVFPGTPTRGLEAGPVVAVVGDTVFGHPREPDQPRMYESGGPFASMESILLKTRLSTEEVRQELDRLIERGDLEIEVGSIDRLSDRVDEMLAPDRARMQMSALAASVVVFLALIGFYGTQRFLVEAGKREYAILAALGAGPKRLRRMVLNRGLLLGLPGLVFAAPLSYIALAWLKQDFLPESVPSLALVVAVTIALAGLLVLATAGPARRAANLAPAEQLRED
jgi:putative ABC transport system permease protein